MTNDSVDFNAWIFISEIETIQAQKTKYPFQMNVLHIYIQICMFAHNFHGMKV